MNAPIDISKVTLSTERLILRPFLLSDLDDFYEYASVEGVGEQASWPHHQSKEESLSILREFIEEKKTFAVVEKNSNKVIGSIGIDKYKEDLLPEFQIFMGRELGCVLAKPYWGHGLMPEAIAKVIEYLFLNVRLDFIVYTHSIENHQSQRVCEKNHFQFVKQFMSQTLIKKEDQFYLYILHYEEWKNGKI